MSVIVIDHVLCTDKVRVYCIAGKFGRGKVWRIWQITRHLPNLNHPNLFTRQSILKYHVRKKHAVRLPKMSEILKYFHLTCYKAVFVEAIIFLVNPYYRIAQNFGGENFWRFWRIHLQSPKFHHPKLLKFVNYTN